MNYLDKLKKFSLSKKLVAETFILSEALANPGIFERCEKDEKDINFLLDIAARHKEVSEIITDYMIYIAACNEVAIEEAVEYEKKLNSDPSSPIRTGHFQEDPQHAFIAEKKRQFKRLQEKKEKIKEQNKELYTISSDEWLQFYTGLKVKCRGSFDIQKKEFQQEFIEHGCVCVLWRFTDLFYIEQTYRNALQRLRRKYEDDTGKNFNQDEVTVPSLTAQPIGDLFFRGQANCFWRLIPSVFRPLSDREYVRHDNPAAQSLDGFNIPKLNIYLPYIELRNNQIFKKYIKAYKQSYENEFNLYEIGQHHGMPTRLLDWSKNFLKALFFACCDSANLDCNGIVYGFYPNPVFLKCLLDNICEIPCRVVEQDIKNEKEKLAEIVFGDSEIDLRWETQVPPRIVSNVEPYHYDQRTLCQQGAFTIHYSDFINFLELPFFPALRVIVPKLLKRNLIVYLSKSGVNYQTLFPDLDHFCYHLKISSCMTDLLDGTHENDIAFYCLENPYGSSFTAEMIHKDQQIADMRENMSKCSNKDNNDI